MVRILIFTIIINFIWSLNYSEDISQIIYNNCTSCHRSGEIAAFLPLTNYSQVNDNKYWIAYSIEGTDDRHGDPIMPPWPPDRTYSTFIDERYLTDEEVHSFLEWIELGAPEGNPDLEYPMPDFPEGSSIGEPDLVFQLEEPYFIEGNYEDDWRCFIIPTGFEEDKEIAAIEFRPDNKEAVHHSIITVVPGGYADQVDAADPGYGYECYGDFNLDILTPLVDGYAPGMRTTLYPDGIGDIIPANSDLIVQMHYAPLSTNQFDQSSINIFFKDEPIEREVQHLQHANPMFVLPPNTITEVIDSIEINTDLSLLQILPHSHLIGETWEIYSVDSQQDTTKIIKINNWDFDWQSFYTPEYMLPLTAGSTIYMKATYDNTSSNPDNPNDPPQYVFWGDGTEDEMFFVAYRYLEYEQGDENIYLGSNDDLLLGDVNQDSMINVLDVVTIVQFVLDFSTPSDLQFDLSDLNNDQVLDVMDIVILINIILN